MTIVVVGSPVVGAFAVVDEFWFQWLGLLQQANPEAYLAYTSTRKDSLKILQAYIQDYLDEDNLE